MSIALNVNHRSVTVDAPADMPLLWVLRDVLKLDGHEVRMRHRAVRRVHRALDGKAVRSCMTRVSGGRARPITTIEGLSPDGLHPVQVAWEAIDVPQCGYCQAGQIMSAAALLAQDSASHG